MASRAKQKIAEGDHEPAGRDGPKAHCDFEITGAGPKMGIESAAALGRTWSRICKQSSMTSSGRPGWAVVV